MLSLAQFTIKVASTLGVTCAPYYGLHILGGKEGGGSHQQVSSSNWKTSSSVMVMGGPKGSPILIERIQKC